MHRLCIRSAWHAKGGLWCTCTSGGSATPQSRSRVKEDSHDSLMYVFVALRIEKEPDRENKYTAKKRTHYHHSHFTSLSPFLI